MKSSFNRKILEHLVLHIFADFSCLTNFAAQANIKENSAQNRGISSRNSQTTLSVHNLAGLMLFAQCTLICCVGLFSARFKLIPKISCAKSPQISIVYNLMFRLYLLVECNISICSRIHFFAFASAVINLLTFETFSFIFTFSWDFCCYKQHVQCTLSFLLFCRRYKLNMNVVEKWMYVYVLLLCAP